MINIFCCVQSLSRAVRWISDSAGEGNPLRGARMVLTGERGIIFVAGLEVFCSCLKNGFFK